MTERQLLICMTAWAEAYAQHMEREHHPAEGFGWMSVLKSDIECAEQSLSAADATTGAPRE